MAIPGSTTTVAVMTPTQPEPYEAAAWTVASSGTRAVIGAPSGREGMATGSAEVVDAVLNADPVPLSHGQAVVDESTDETWQVVWVHQRTGFGLGHTRAGLRRVEMHLNEPASESGGPFATTVGLTESGGPFATPATSESGGSL